MAESCPAPTQVSAGLRAVYYLDLFRGDVARVLLATRIGKPQPHPVPDFEAVDFDSTRGIAIASEEDRVAGERHHMPMDLLARMRFHTQTCNRISRSFSIDCGDEADEIGFSGERNLTSRFCAGDHRRGQQKAHHSNEPVETIRSHRFRFRASLRALAVATGATEIEILFPTPR